MDIFEFTAPLMKSVNGFIALKGNLQNLKQGQIKIDGKKYSPEDNVSIAFKLKDVDKNGTFRFYYKTPDSNKWCRYAYFFPNKGQKIYIASYKTCRVARILIGQKLFFSLKDAYVQFAYAKGNSFPVSSKKIRALAANDTLPNRQERCIESKRFNQFSCPAPSTEQRELVSCL
jgi:hypothetical protein